MVVSDEEFNRLALRKRKNKRVLTLTKESRSDINHKLDSNNTAIRQPLDSNFYIDSTADKTAKAPSSNINNITTTKKPKTINVPNNISAQIPSNPKKIGFGERDVQKILEAEKVKEDELLDSLHAFSYDLKNDSIKAKKGLLNFFMGILLKKGPYKSEKLSVDSKKKMAEYVKRIEESKVAQEVLERVISQK